MTERVRLHTTPRVRLHDTPHRERLHDQPKGKRRAKAAPRYMAFTEPRIAALRPKASPYLTWDRNDPKARTQESVAGLTVLTQPKGTKAYHAFFNLPKQPARSIVLGRVDDLSLEEARKRTREIRKNASKGIDPRAGDDLEARIAALEKLLASLKAEKQMANVDVASRVTFAKLVDEWHREAQAGNRSAKEVRSLVHFHTKEWASRPALSITKREAAELVQGIALGTRIVDGKTARPMPPTAARLLAHLHSLFTWAVDQDKAGIKASPMRGVKLPVAVRKAATEGRKRGWFAGEEADAVIKAVWQLADELGGDKARFLKLLILTGKRRNAVMAMRWEQVSAGWYWTPIKGSDIKKNNPIPLPALAQRVLGSRHNAGKVMKVSEEAAQQLMRTVRARLKLPDGVRERLGLPVPGLGLPDYLHHGLRHIFETRTGQLGVLPHVRDLLLDHAIARSASGRGYDHSQYEAQLLEALTTWADHVERLVTPKDETGKPAANVTVLR